MEQIIYSGIQQDSLIFNDFQQIEELRESINFEKVDLIETPDNYEIIIDQKLLIKFPVKLIKDKKELENKGSIYSNVFQIKVVDKWKFFMLNIQGRYNYNKCQLSKFTRANVCGSTINMPALQYFLLKEDTIMLLLAFQVLSNQIQSIIIQQITGKYKYTGIMKNFQIFIKNSFKMSSKNVKEKLQEIKQTVTEEEQVEQYGGPVCAADVNQLFFNSVEKKVVTAYQDQKITKTIIFQESPKDSIDKYYCNIVLSAQSCQLNDKQDKFYQYIVNSLLDLNFNKKSEDIQNRLKIARITQKYTCGFDDQKVQQYIEDQDKPDTYYQLLSKAKALFNAIQLVPTVKSPFVIQESSMRNVIIKHIINLIYLNVPMSHQSIILENDKYYYIQHPIGMFVQDGITPYQNMIMSQQQLFGLHTDKYTNNEFNMVIQPQFTILNNQNGKIQQLFFNTKYVLKQYVSIPNQNNQGNSVAASDMEEN